MSVAIRHHAQRIFKIWIVHGHFDIQSKNTRNFSQKNFWSHYKNQKRFREKCWFFWQFPAEFFWPIQKDNHKKKENKNFFTMVWTRYVWTYTLQLLHFFILKSKSLWKNQILIALYNSELSRHLHSEKSPMSMTKWKLSRIFTMGSKFFWSSISMNSNTLRNSQYIFLSHFHEYIMRCSNSLGYILGNHSLDKNSNKTSERFWPHCWI